MYQVTFPNPPFQVTIGAPAVSDASLLSFWKSPPFVWSWSTPLSTLVWFGKKSLTSLLTLGFLPRLFGGPDTSPVLSLRLRGADSGLTMLGEPEEEDSEDRDSEESSLPRCGDLGLPWYDCLRRGELPLNRGAGALSERSRRMFPPLE
jgi:hypothetical protein